MQIMDFLCPKAIKLDLDGGTKKEVLAELVDLLAKAKEINNPAKIVKVLLEREELGSTGIGHGIAIPHGKSDIVNKIVAAFGISKKGIDFEALDGEPVYLIFLLIAPPDSAGDHLKALGRIVRLLKDKFFRQALRDAQTVEDVINIIKDEDK